MTEKGIREEAKDFNLAVDVIMLAGTLLLQSGSETYRVEDTMIRIAHSQGIIDCNALAMPVAIFFSIENTNVSRMKRNLKTNYNIEKVCDVNQVSRQLVTGEISLQEAFDELNRLKVKELPYNNKQLIAAATLSALLLHHVWRKFLRCFGGCHCYLLWLCLLFVCGQVYPHSFCDSFCWSLRLRTTGSYGRAIPVLTPQMI